MKKIPSLYLRDPENLRFVTPTLNERCRWVFEDASEYDHANQVHATVKWDGTCVMRDTHGQWWARHQLRPGKKTPENYISVEHDPVTGKTQGWIPMAQSQYRKFFDEAVEHAYRIDRTISLPATYELVGPRIGANPHRKSGHELIPHGKDVLISPPPWKYHDLAEYLKTAQLLWGYFEGIVWHHRDGRMAKIKTKDFLENRD